MNLLKILTGTKRMKKVLIITVLLITQLLINCREKQDDMTGLFALLAAAARL